MKDECLPEDWAILREWLPGDLNERARRLGFFQRARGLQDAERWLRIILMHVAGGLSLEQTAVRSGEMGLADISGVALFKRLRRAEPWLRDITDYLLIQQRSWSGRLRWPWKQSLRVIDTTEVQEPGATGSCWRIHYSLRLPELCCDHYELTDSSGGEKLGRFDFAAGELVIVDRGYSHRVGVAGVLNAGANVLVRWNHALFPLEDASGDPLDPLKTLKKLKIGQVGELPAWFACDGKRYPIRLCFRRKGKAAAARALRGSLRKAQKNGTQPDPVSLKLTEFILVLTSVDAQTMDTSAALELYRTRWQVELAFKRLKTLLGMGHVPKSNDASAKAWMQAKILTSLLIERTIIEGCLFSPWGDPRPGFEQVANLPGGA
jgi:hypothetical protein